MVHFRPAISSRQIVRFSISKNNGIIGIDDHAQIQGTVIVIHDFHDSSIDLRRNHLPATPQRFSVVLQKIPIDVHHPLVFLGNCRFETSILENDPTFLPKHHNFRGHGHRQPALLFLGDKHGPKDLQNAPPLHQHIPREFPISHGHAGAVRNPQRIPTSPRGGSPAAIPARVDGAGGVGVGEAEGVSAGGSGGGGVGGSAGDLDGRRRRGRERGSSDSGSSCCCC
mmetsp:Transcript_3078/g.6648  ORF Transcript_3078/g.6648 Transcript_3078/m.6648 type:complete len:225 (-) Transcript_3078:546-1220(-)